MPILGTSASQNTKSFLSVPVDFLVIAGGGSTSGLGGAGGAGGYRTSYGTSGENSSPEAQMSLNTGVTYTVTVGAGGSFNSNGSNSVFNDITSIGGGKRASSGGSGGSEAAGTANQGYAGGNVYPNPGSPYTFYVGGGGGGAGSAGGNGYSSGGVFRGGDGGNGLASSITGTSVTRAGGGGGHANATYYNVADGSPGTGGGGGTPNSGGGAQGSGGGNSGASGVVILRAERAASATTGSPVYTTSGSYHIYQFNGNGSITF